MLRLATTLTFSFAALAFSGQAAANPVLNFELIDQSSSNKQRQAVELKVLNSGPWTRSMEGGGFKFCPKVNGVATAIKGDACLYRAREGSDVVNRTAATVDAQELLNQHFGEGNAYLLGLAPSATGVGISYTNVPGKAAFNHGYLTAPAYRETPDGFAMCPPEVQGKVIRSIDAEVCTYAFRKDGETLEAQARLVNSSTFLSMSIDDNTLEVVGVAVSPGGSSQIGLRQVGTLPPKLVVYYAHKPRP